VNLEKTRKTKEPGTRQKIRNRETWGGKNLPLTREGGGGQPRGRGGGMEKKGNSTGGKGHGHGTLKTTLSSSIAENSP